MAAAASAAEPGKRGMGHGSGLSGSQRNGVRSGNTLKETWMNGKHVSNLAAAAVFAVGLFAGSVGWAAAQDQPARDPHQHENGTPVAAARIGAPEDAMTGMVRDIMADMMPGMMADMMPGMMADMMPGMMADMMPGMMGGMKADMIDRMMACMMGDMSDGMGGAGMMGGTEDDDMRDGMARDRKSGRYDDRDMRGMTDDQHARMQAVVAETLDLTVDELETELAAGKSVRDIAEEQGVDLTEVHEAVMDELGLATR